MAQRNGEASTQLLRPNLNKALAQAKQISITSKIKFKTEALKQEFCSRASTKGLVFPFHGPSLALPRSHPWTLVTPKQAPLRTPSYRAKFWLHSFASLHLSSAIF